MKKHVFILILLLVESVFSLSYAAIPVVWSVYSARFLSDDVESSELLHKLVQKTGNKEVDVLNSLALSEVARLSDGALAELMGMLCKDDMINKTETIIYIFENFGEQKLEPYFLQISFELLICDEFQSDSKNFNDFVGSVRKTDLSPKQLRTLDKIINAIKKDYEYYKENE